ncbi:MAG: penicillin-binding protein 2 [Nitrospinota bacterium]
MARTFRPLGNETPEAYRRRLRLLAVWTAIAFGGLFLRVWQLQVIQGDTYRALSESNRISTRVIKSPRGLMLDRNGYPLAENRPAFNLLLLKEDVRDMEGMRQVLVRALGMDPEEVDRRLAQGGPFRPILIKADIRREAVAYFEEHRPELPGVILEPVPTRRYRHQRLASHVLGYLSEATDRQLRRSKEKFPYQPGDMVGQFGLERLAEAQLRGFPGLRYVEVDAYGRELQVLRRRPSLPGNDIRLSIDLTLQGKAESLLDGHTGSIVALDPGSGEVLALVSRPGFDPNQFATGVEPRIWGDLIRNPLHPFQNRAWQGQYPPGSVFKIVLAAAGLEEGLITPKSRFYCPGHFRLGRRVFRGWKPGGHGWVDLKQAVAQSCDVFFYQLGQRLGIDRIAAYARRFGLGRPTGLMPQEEKAGLVPSRGWKRRAIGEPWYPGDTIPVSIGQGYNLVTPIQLANLIAAVANGGILYRPFMVKEVLDPEGNRLRTSAPQVEGRLGLRPSTLRVLQDALREVVNGPKGTGWRARLKGVQVAGKTGTVQVVRNLTVRKKNQEDIPYRFRDHGWFVAYAPFEKPSIALAILVEHGGRGGSYFANIAKELIATHLGLEPPARLAQERRP